jgi:hypothetical protein
LQLQPQEKLTFNLLQEFALKIAVSFATSTARTTEIDLQEIARIPLEDRSFIFKLNFNVKKNQPSIYRKNSL